MEDYLQKVNALVSEAIQTARDEGKREAASEYESQIERLRVQASAAYTEGYKKGMADAKAEQQVIPEPQDPDMPEINEIDPLCIIAEDGDFETIGLDTYNGGKANFNQLYAIPVC